MEGQPNFSRQINLYRFSTAAHRKLELQEHIGKTWCVEKNWSPFIIENVHLYFLYKYEDTQVIDCTEEHLPCKRQFGSDKGSSRTFGSSLYIRFLNTNYFVSFAQAKYDFIKPHHRPALSIIEALEGGDFKIIYTSKPLNSPSTLLANPKWINTKFSKNDIRRIMMVTSIANWDFQSGIADLMVSLDDEIAVAIKVDRLRDFVHYMINVYEYGRLPDENNGAVSFGRNILEVCNRGVLLIIILNYLLVFGWFL
ncbi:unnamed protein product [Blepharisma stoltei]|uniref:Uncharacterized protein n=1 Tax=Blepharisma stoltei TaxID=1481888 RepID=A0AAU9JB46_9CILI|nr:unnamed protein product [Blepharisma stoltei]